MRLIDADLLGLTDMEIVMCDGDYKEALKMLIDKIEHATTIEPQRWIPVTEVMPNEHNMVLILTDDGTIFIGDHNEYWEDDYEFEIDDVIAWMPLPEAWRGEQDGQNN